MNNRSHRSYTIDQSNRTDPSDHSPFRLRRAALAAVLLLLPVLSPGAPAPKARWGEIVYPLFGNIRADEGTIIVWFRIEEPLPGRIGEWYQPKQHWNRFMVARLHVNEASNLSLFWKPGRGKGRMWTGVHLSTFPKRSPNMTGGGAKWKTGEARFVAYTWDKRGTHRWWPGGKLKDHMTGTGVEKGLGRVDEKTSRLVLGGRRTTSALTFYGVHILDKALGAEDLERPASALFQARPETLLLDRFEDEDFVPDGKRETRAETITGFKGERGGVPSPACRFVRTPHGRGLRVYAPPEGFSVE